MFWSKKIFSRLLNQIQAGARSGRVLTRGEWGVLLGVLVLGVLTRLFLFLYYFYFVVLLQRPFSMFFLGFRLLKQAHESTSCFNDVLFCSALLADEQ